MKSLNIFLPHDFFELPCPPIYLGDQLNSTLNMFYVENLVTKILTAF